MDDSCAVCADVLEWVAYGLCGHREVCSTCVARLRFICEDHTCCICKTHSDVVFVTKALGDYTRMINDFSVLPKVREGRVGSYWYHEDTQAFFDDIDHYKMIKAMCRLSCSVCDKMEGQPHNGSKHRANFRNIEQLKGHLFHQHKLLMCSLCLEGRKVFICEQKLYTRAQLKQHISTGASEVDGTESERGGFTGHPLCEFCRTPFYGENELYSHMSTEHYTCHICQRQHPGHYEYYKNYDDLEIHFRRDHFLCEDDACLTKKFIVFPSEEALKRHNALEHGGRMSRSKRNAALQIPTSFQYRRSNEQDRRRGRGRAFQINSESQLSMAIEASLETANADHMFHDPPSTSSLQVDPDAEGTSDIDPTIQPFESLATTDSELPSRYLQALGRSRNAPLEESSFPPLPMAPKNSQQKPKQESENFPSNSMAAHLRRQRNVTDLNSAQAWSAASCGPRPIAADSTKPRPTTNSAPVKSHSYGQSKIATGNGLASSSYASLAEAWPTPALLSVGSSRDSGNTGRIRHSASAPDLVESESVKPSISDFPLVSVAQLHKLPRSSQVSLNVQDVQTANRSLVEKVRAALEFNEDRYTAFKGISGQYRQGLIDTGRYLDFVQKFGLSHLILELARLCPDEQKQQELVETYNASLRNNVPQANGRGTGNSHLKESNGSKKGKGKSIVAEGSSSKDRLANNILSTLKQLQSAYKPLEEAAAEVLSRDGYRDSKGGNSKVLMDEHLVELITGNQPLMKLGGQNDSPLAGSISNQNIRDGGGGSKQRKKTTKFLRARLGDGSVSSLLDHKNTDPDSNPEAMDESSDGGGLPVRGVWRNGGGHKLFT